MGLLCILKSDEMKELIKEARYNRALSNNSDANIMIEITDNARDQLLGLLPNKSKFFKEVPIHTVTPGRANFLLEKGVKLRRAKAEHKKYPAKFKIVKIWSCRWYGRRKEWDKLGNKFFQEI